MTHYFKKTTRKRKGKVIYRCDRCDSESLFAAGTTDAQANQYIATMYPKFHCIVKN